MQNVVINMCEKFQFDRLSNYKALGNGKPDSNKKNNVRSAWRPVSGIGVGNGGTGGYVPS